MLEHEAEHAEPKPGQLAVAESPDVSTFEEELALGRPIERSEPDAETEAERRKDRSSASSAELREDVGKEEHDAHVGAGK